MSRVEELWDKIQCLTTEEKIIIYKRLKHEVYNKSLSFHGNKHEEKEDNYRY
jgi:hypothetical protein